MTLAGRTSLILLTLAAVSFVGVGRIQCHDSDVARITGISVAAAKERRFENRHERHQSKAVVLDSMEVATFDNLMRAARAQEVHEMPLGEAVQWVAERFVGSRYVSGMLDLPHHEQLVVSFRKFDCVLFVETVLALARGIVNEDYSLDGFTNRLQEIRYRGGEIEGYASRLHYFSDWVRDNEERGLLKNVTIELGGVRRFKKLDFMSRNKRLYKKLARNDSLVRRIADMQEDIEQFPIYHVPREKVKAAMVKLQPGDVVSTATRVRGLDVSHTGLAYRNPDGSMGFLHASSSARRVVISRSLPGYVYAQWHREGIVVARPIERAGTLARWLATLGAALPSLLGP